MDIARSRTFIALRFVAYALSLSVGLGISPVAEARHGIPPYRGSRSAAEIPVAGGVVEVALVPDRGQALPLVSDGGGRWRFEGPTQAMVGASYSLVLRNHTYERLKIVVGVDGLNVYEREVVAGRADSDVGSIVEPWTERTLPGWQSGDHRAQRFVFSPREWSEGEGRTDAQIGLVTVQVYREWRPHYGDYREGDAQGGLRRGSEDGAEAPPAAAPAEPRAQTQESRSGGAQPPIGTTSGDDVDNHVRTVRFQTTSPYPEAWAVIDYGQPTPPAPRWPRPHADLLGLRLEGDPYGTRIVAVSPGSPAEEAGLRPWDVIVRLDTLSLPSVGATRRLLESKRSGEYTFVRVRRGSHELAVKIRG
jgi:hypothetical protein